METVYEQTSQAEKDALCSQFRAVFESIPQGIILFDAAGSVANINPQAIGFLGIEDTTAVMGQPFADFARHLLPGKSAETIEQMTHLLRQHRQGMIEVRLPSGQTYEARFGPVSDGGLMITLCEATARVVKDHSADDARKAAELANKAKSEFLAMMSHELRTPMNAVLGMAGLLAKSDLDEEQCENVKTLLDAGDVLMSILNDILDLSKIEAGKLKVEEIDLDVRHVLRKMERLWRPTVDDKGLRFAVKMDDNVPSAIKGDPTRIRQVLFNLLSNATKFTQDGEISVHVGAKDVSDTDATLIFEVRDSGIGMSEEQKSRLFTTFEQADGSITRRFGGTGLGLAISRQLAQLMQGDITVQSIEGEGTTFTLSLKAKIAISHKPKKEDTGSKKNALKKGVRILAVEDNPINQRVLASFLRPVGGEVTWAGHGEEALKIADVSQFDVILMDIQMPVMDGLSATKALRASNSQNRETPIIAMTANAMMGDRETCLAAGMSDYISKPIDPRALYTAIARAASISRARQKSDVQNIA
jgi:signal transduction histidine kinase/AmiR/NasT family two-component response regulator